jgi:hypothetical protein
MHRLRPGQDIVLSWRAGAVECRVIAAAGRFVLLRADRDADPAAPPPAGSCSLTYLEGMVPMGWDGSVEPGGHPGELRFRVSDQERSADRRSAVRVPVAADVRLEHGPDVIEGRLLDVSAGGLRVRHPGRIPAGSPVHLRAELPGGLVIDAAAVVRTSEPGISSVEFTALHAADAQAIGAWTVQVMRAALAG